MTPVPPAQLSRRMIIGLGLAAPTLAVPWLAGCSSGHPAAGNPVRAVETPAAPMSSPAATPTASPSPTAAASGPPPAAAAPEQALAALAGVILGGPHRQQLSKDRRALLTFLRTAHSAHAHAIANPPPTPAPVRTRRAITERLARTLGGSRDCRCWRLPPSSAADHGVGGPAVGVTCGRRRRLRWGAWLR